MAALGLNHYNLRAPLALLTELREFYCEFVGLVQGERPSFNTVGYWLYAGPDAVLHLSKAGDDETRQTAVKTTFDHAAFTCGDFDAMRAKLDAHGIAYKLSEVPHRKQRQIFFSDPAGNGIELNFTLD